MAAPSTSTNSPEGHAELNELLNGPAGKPPIGVVPNFHNPPNLDAVFIATTTLCASVAALAVLIRLYTKLVLIRSIAYEDYVIVIAFIGEIGFIITSSFILKSGGGLHMWDLQLKGFFRILYWLNVSAIVYGIVVFLIKLSILLQYLRIFVPNRKGNLWMYIAIHIVIGSLFVFYLANTVFEIAMCQPREKIWNLLITSGHCFNTNAPPMATGIFNIISDFAILVLPIAPISKLQMPRKKKLMVAAIFATGISACATSILRTLYTWKIVLSPDISYNILRMGLWTAAEMTTGILVSCLPVTPRFFQHFGLKIYTTLSHSSKALSSKIRSRSGVKDSTSQGVTKVGGGGSEGSETVPAGYGAHGMGQGKYITLDGFEMAVLGRERSVGVDEVTQAGMRGDREAKLCAV